MFEPLIEYISMPFSGDVTIWDWIANIVNITILFVTIRVCREKVKQIFKHKDK